MGNNGRITRMTMKTSSTRTTPGAMRNRTIATGYKRVALSPRHGRGGVLRLRCVLEQCLVLRMHKEAPAFSIRLAQLRAVCKLSSDGCALSCLLDDGPLPTKK